MAKKPGIAQFTFDGKPGALPEDLLKHEEWPGVLIRCPFTGSRYEWYPDPAEVLATSDELISVRWYCCGEGCDHEFARSDVKPLTKFARELLDSEEV